MTKDIGIRALIPGVVTASEEKEIQDAREYIRKKLGVRNELRAAPTTLISDYLAPAVSVKLPAETKDEYGYTPSQNKEIEKQLTKDTSKSKGAWKAFVARNERAEKEKKDTELRRKKQLMRSWGLSKEQQKDKNHYKKMVDFGIDNSSVKYTGSRQHLYDEWNKPEKKNPPKSVNYLSNNYSFAENFKKQSKNINDFSKEKFIIDPKHPDGFRLASDMDLYKNYGDTPVRYIQEIKYKYDGGAAPTDSVVKTFDGADASTFPSDPAEKKALAKYQAVYDKLTPLQKKQLETTQKLKKK